MTHLVELVSDMCSRRCSTDVAISDRLEFLNRGVVEALESHYDLQLERLGFMCDAFIESSRLRGYQKCLLCYELTVDDSLMNLSDV
jgi:hypothetical protein